VLARQRQDRIQEQVRATGGVQVSDLIDLLGVSGMTVRRDLKTLAARGVLARVHGGATGVAPHSTDEPPFLTKSTLRGAAKTAIARLAVTLVEPGTAVALSSGSTAVAVARELLSVPSLTVVTNSVPAFLVLTESGRRDLTTVLTGGIGTQSHGLVGPVAVAALRGLHPDVAFMGVHGVDAQAGLTTPNLAEAETDRALVDCARRLVVVADSSKWGVVGLAAIAPLAAVDVFITDADLAPDARSALAGEVGELLVADAEDPGRGC